MLIMASGFVLAASLPFANFSSTTVNGNQGSVNTVGTIYQPGISGSVFYATTVGTCASTESGTGSTLTTVTAWLEGGPSACLGGNDYVLQLTFSSGSPACLGISTYTDEFVVSSEFGGATSFTTGQVQISCQLTATPGECVAVLNIDTGVLSTAAQPTVNAVDITVTGS